jgi:hypothetical protein
VTATDGHTAGVGSRYFTVSNGALSSDAGFRLKAESTARLKAESTARLKAEATAPAARAVVRGRRGFDLTGPFLDYAPDANGRVTIQAEELDRIELALVPGVSGALRTPSGFAPLPAGSHLDAATGTFTWMPGPGFIGSYDLLFGGQDVRIVLNPKRSNRVGVQTIVDAPVVGRVFRRAEPIIVTGWGADLASFTDTGVDAVHVWAYPVSTDGQWTKPVFLGEASYGGVRPDVGAIYGERFTGSGYGLVVSDLAAGTYDLAVFAHSTVTGQFGPAKLVRIVVW